MRNQHISCSPLTNRIFCGRVNKAGNAYLDGKVDVTGQVCGAVAEHVFNNGEPVVVTYNGTPAWEITVRKLVKEEPKKETASRRKMTSAELRNWRAAIGKTIKIEWAANYLSWPFFTVVNAMPRGVVQLKSADYPDGSQASQGTTFWVDACEIKAWGAT